MPFRRLLRLVSALALSAVAARAQTVVLSPNTSVLDQGGGNVTFTATVSYPSGSSTVAFSAPLPTGWAYVSGTNVAGTNPGEPLITPAAGRTGTLEWAFVNAPASPATFTFVASYPANVVGTLQIQPVVQTRDGTGAAATVVNAPAISISGFSTQLTWAGGNADWGTAANWRTPASEVSVNAPNNSATHYSATVASGIATLGTAVVIDNLTFTGGTINGASTLTLTGAASSWTAGIFAGVGEIVIAPGGQLAVSGANAHVFGERTLRNQGTVTWTGTGALQSGTGGAFINTSTGNFVDAASSTSDNLIQNPNPGGGSFTFANAGSYTKTAATTTVVSVPFTNTGKVFVNAGTLRFTNTFTHTDAVVNVAPGATVRFDQAVTFTGGSLQGGGTVIATITHSGDVAPGSPVGTLTVDGHLTLLNTSRLLIDIAGTTQTNAHDAVSVTGAGTIALQGGAFSFTMLSGSESTILNSQTYTILSGASLSGTFAGIANGTRIYAANGGLGSFIANYTATSFTLSNFIAVPEPSTWALMIAGLGIVAFASLRRRR